MLSLEVRLSMSSLITLGVNRLSSVMQIVEMPAMIISFVHGFASLASLRKVFNARPPNVANYWRGYRYTGQNETVFYAERVTIHYIESRCYVKQPPIPPGYRLFCVATV